MDPKKILVLVGPTAVGKSSLAMRLAPELNAEIVSADSMQIYRGMDIGTGKPTADERRRVAHHLVDCVEPDEPFHAVRFQKEADRAIEDIHARGKLPMVVGGTGLYIKALLHGLFEDPGADTFKKWDEKLRHYRSLGDNAYESLAALDPEAAGRIHPKDEARARRALEVFLRTGRSITVLQERHRFQEERYEALTLGLTMDRQRLFDRIHRRIDRMVRAGLLEEVRSLLARGCSPDLPAMRSLGYRHMAKVVSGDWEMSDAIRLLKRDTRRYAKRQFTWFYNQEKVEWLTPPFRAERILVTIRGFLTTM